MCVLVPCSPDCFYSYLLYSDVISWGGEALVSSLYRLVPSLTDQLCDQSAKSHSGCTDSCVEW